MNTITRIALTALLAILTATQVSAQFHTVTDTRAIKRKAQPTTETPVVEPRPKKQSERTSHALHAAHPLRHIHITSPFGWRTDPFTKKKAFHNGIDLRANYETRLCHASRQSHPHRSQPPCRTIPHAPPRFHHRYLLPPFQNPCSHRYHRPSGYAHRHHRQYRSINSAAPASVGESQWELGKSNASLE